MRILFYLGGLLITGGLLMAQTNEAPLREAMKKIGPGNGALGKKIAAKDATAAADAKQLATWFAGVEKFWKARKTADAVTFSKTAGADYKAVGKLIAAGKWDDAAAAHKKIGATCKGCHDAHREKAADGWKIK
jgi:cytochrome c556